MPALGQFPGLVSFKDTIYDFRADKKVAKFLGTGKGWQIVASNVTQFAVGNTMYAADTSIDTTYGFKNSDGTWKVIDRIPERKHLAASAKFIYKIHVDQGRIYQYSSKDWNLVDDGEKVTDIAVDDDDTLYQLHADGRITKYLGSEGWKEIDSTPNVQSILVGGGKVYKIHKDNSLYVHVVDYDWDRIDKNPDTVQVAAGPAGVFQRRRDGTVWQYDESDKKWTQPTQSPGYVDIAVGNHFYGKHSNSSIYRYDPASKSWTGPLN